MEAQRNRNLQDGTAFNHLFPDAGLSQKTIKRGAYVEDTVAFIPKVIAETSWQTKELSKSLKKSTLYETCRNIWDFVYSHINYHKDSYGLEQIRSPARTWHDRMRGVDCDCYSTFIGSLLYNLKIPFVLRITKYRKNFFQHIYPIVPLKDGSHITIDCVVDQYDYEEPFTEKKDTPMDLQYLDGIESNSNIDVQDLFGDYDDLGKLFKKKNKANPTTSSTDTKKKSKLKTVLSKGLHLTNRINPATLVLRNGILAAMKLNIFKVAQRLKWGYLSEAEARKRAVDIAKWQKLTKVREKMEKIFYDAGGKPENLKKAILGGKGNKNKEVSGLFGFYPETMNENINGATSIRDVLGEELWHGENVNGMEDFEGFGGLGEPATAASVTAASGVLAAISGLLKSIGSIFPKKEKGSEDFENTESEDAAASKVSDSGSNLPAKAESSSVVKTDASSDDSASSSSDDSSGNDEETEGFWNKNKKWLKPTLWGVGGLAILYLGYRFATSKNNKANDAESLSGFKKLKPKKGNKTDKTDKKSEVKKDALKKPKPKPESKPKPKAEDKPKSKPKKKSKKKSSKKKGGKPPKKKSSIALL